MNRDQPGPYLILIGGICLALIVLVGVQDPHLLAWPPKNPSIFGVGLALLSGSLFFFRKKSAMMLGLMLGAVGGLFSVLGYVFA